jgi:(4S)-4-hydroxy-5-phosphonooxypentane-2,3-dione isomerase
MSQIAIIVEFETLPGEQAQFETVIREHARRTKADEPGCLRFEVLHVVDETGARVPNKLMVNELYADAAAVAAHRGTDRMKQVGAALGPLLASRRLMMAEVDA